MMQTFNVTQQPAVIVFNSQGECEASAYFKGVVGCFLNLFLYFQVSLNNFVNAIYNRLYKIYVQTLRGIYCIFVSPMKA